MTGYFKKVLTPWDSQPQEPVLIDTGNPLTQGFTSFLYPIDGILFDACGSLQNNAFTAITDGVSKIGKNLEFNGTTSGVNFGDVETVNFAGAYSIFVLFRPDAQSGARREMLLAKDVLGGRQFSIELNPKGTSGAAVGQTAAIGHTRWSSGAAFYQKYSNANVISNGNWYSLLIGSTDGSTDIVAYLNGADLSLSAGSGSATGLVVNTATALTAGRRAYVGAEDYFDGGIAAIGIANVAPSALLAKALYENPYQLLEGEQRQVWVPTSAGGSPTVVTLDPAAFNLTPQGTQNTLGTTLTASALNFTAQDVQNNVINNLTAAAFDFVAHDIAAENASTATVTLDTATFDFVANDNQNALYAELSAATCDFISNDAQPLTAHSLDVCAFDFVGQDTQNTLGLLLENAIFDFVTRPITAGDPLAPTTGRATNMMLMGVGN